MELVIYLGGALVFFALVMASIALHEIGHLVPAKIFGVKVTQYFVGFGRTLWSRRRGETEFGVKLLPLGGYVRLVGMFPPAATGGRMRRSSTGPFSTLADSARAAEWESIGPEDDGRLFYQKKSWQKIVIMAGGPAMNILLAFVILLGVTGIYGVYRTQPVIAQVQECMVPADAPDTTSCAGRPATPAKLSGIQVGDRIVAFNGATISSWSEMSEAIRGNLGERAQITVERAGQRVELTPVNTVVNGVPSTWDPSKRIAAGFLGVEPVVRRERGGPVAVVGDMWRMTQQTAYALVRFPAKVYHTAADLVTGKPRDVYGPMSIVGASRAAGEVASTDQIGAADKVATLFSLLGSVNLFVALFNFVPLLPLDGGHIAGALYEALKRALARLRSKPDPGHVDTAKMLPVAYVVGAVIAISGVVLILADLIDPIRLF
jgi:membrane-associated protease RseP (regulator of RpoE activity)